MDKLKKIVIVFACIVVILIIGVIYQLNTENNYQQKPSKPKVIVTNKTQNKDTEDNMELEDELEDISEENTEKILSASKNAKENQENNANTDTQEHHQIITTPATSTTSQTPPTQTEPPQSLSEEEKIMLSNEYLGTAGRLYIPSINMNVGLYNASIYNDSYNAQEIVDREDSAAFYTFGSKLTISDHDYQGFSKISNLAIYDKAYIKKSNSVVETYQLINKFAGKNMGSDLVDYSGNSVKQMNGSLIMYTCYGTGNGIMITLWNRMA